LSSRGQGRAFCARRPRIMSPTIHPTLKGSDKQGRPLPGPKASKARLTVGFHPRLFMASRFAGHANHNARCPAKAVGHAQPFGRRREIAIRTALGGTGAGVVRLVLREGLVLVAIGLAASLAGAAGLQRSVASQIYGVRPLDPLVIGGVSVLLGTIALAACVVPAWRAVRVDPVAVLKEE